LAKAKKRNKKYITKDYFVGWLEITSFIEPIKRFVHEVKNDEVYHDDRNEALISLTGLDVVELAKKGKTPFSAEYNLRLLAEIIYQTAIFSQSDINTIKTVIDSIKDFDRLFIAPLRHKTIMQKSGVIAAETFMNVSVELLKKTKISQFHTVLMWLSHVVETSVKNSWDVITNDQFRDWLVKTLISKNDMVKLNLLGYEVIKSDKN
jgi:hypothetical protein